MMIQPPGHDMQPKKKHNQQRGREMTGETVTGFMYCLRKHSYNEWVQNGLFISTLSVLSKKDVLMQHSLDVAVWEQVLQRIHGVREKEQKPKWQLLETSLSPQTFEPIVENALG